MARGGMFQDECWVYNDLEGCTGEGLLVTPEIDGSSPNVVFLKPSGRPWQRFFLDAGLGFWGEYEDAEVLSELEDPPPIDYGQRLGLLGRVLGSVRCEPEPRILVDMTDVVLIFDTGTPNQLD